MWLCINFDLKASPKFLNADAPSGTGYGPSETRRLENFVSENKRLTGKITSASERVRYKTDPHCVESERFGSGEILSESSCKPDTLSTTPRNQENMRVQQSIWNSGTSAIQPDIDASMFKQCSNLNDSNEKLRKRRKEARSGNEPILARASAAAVNLL